MKKTRSFYIFSIHILILILIFKTDTYLIIANQFDFLKTAPQENIVYRTTLTHQLRIDKTSNENNYVFFGDSLIQGLNVIAIKEKSINFGIGTDTTSALLLRLPKYKASQTAKHIILAIGINDISHIPTLDIANSIEKISNKIPSSTTIFLLGVLPIAQKFESELQKKQSDIANLNHTLQQQVSSTPNITYIPPPASLFDTDGYLKPNAHIGDGLHLNTLGYLLWINHLEKELSNNEN